MYVCMSVKIKDMYNSNIYMKLTSFEIKLKQNKKEFMEINQKFLLINKLNESRSQWQQDKKI